VKLLFVVQRYGPDVPGGAEAACRQFAERMTQRGHEVEALSSTAIDYTNWRNHHPPVTTELNGVTLHRLAVREERDDEQFGPLNARVVFGEGMSPPLMQRRWMQAQGPRLPALPVWLRRHARRFDVVIFFTYLYHPTWSGVPIASSLAPTVLHPTAHDEPQIHMPLFDQEFRHATAFSFFTPEERDLVLGRFRIDTPHDVIGIGVDEPLEGEPRRFRERFGLGDRPYLLFLGRVDPGKGSDEIERFFRAYKERNPGPLAFVVMGASVTRPEVHDDVIVTGFVDEQTKADGLSGATVLAQPSYFESFSLALVEAWMHGVPALVQGHTEVLVGQARRSGGAIPYVGYAEFENALDLLLADPALRAELAENGRRYVEAEYRWDVVLDRYEALLEVARSAWTDPRAVSAKRTPTFGGAT
jgi:glycosyltransferase involved in cell wall biosynthesis